MNLNHVMGPDAHLHLHNLELIDLSKTSMTFLFSTAWSMESTAFLACLLAWVLVTSSSSMSIFKGERERERKREREREMDMRMVLSN